MEIETTTASPARDCGEELNKAYDDVAALIEGRAGVDRFKIPSYWHMLLAEYARRQDYGRPYPRVNGRRPGPRDALTLVREAAPDGLAGLAELARLRYRGGRPADPVVMSSPRFKDLLNDCYDSVAGSVAAAAGDRRYLVPTLWRGVLKGFGRAERLRVYVRARDERMDLLVAVASFARGGAAPALSRLADSAESFLPGSSADRHE